MKTMFTFTFDNPKKIYNRKYMFSINFENRPRHEKALDWLETSGDVLDFIKDMEKYGYHDVSFDPVKEFYGFCSDEISPKDYIKVMELWKDFFIEHDLDCDDIEEVIEDKQIA